MEIPGKNFGIKSKTIQDRVKAEKIIPAKGPGGVSSSNGTEQVAISAKAKDIQQATKVVNATPDIRIEKVDRIKEKITNGTYHISSDQLAEKVIQNIITESEFLG